MQCSLHQRQRLFIPHNSLFNPPCKICSSIRMGVRGCPLSEAALVTVLPDCIWFDLFYFTSPSMRPAQSQTGNWDTCPRARSEKGEVPLSQAGLSFCRHLISNVVKGKHLFNFPIKELDRIKQGPFFSLTDKESHLKENSV